MATNAKLSGPTSLCISSNSDLYFVDGLNKRIRKVDSFGIITTIAGNGNSIFNGDGISATSAQIAPLGVAIDVYNNIYITENNHRIRMINQFGKINTIAGTGIGGYNGNCLPALSCQINDPNGIKIDTCGNVYFADVLNNLIRKIEINPNCIKLSAISLAVDNINLFPNPATSTLQIDNLKTTAQYQLYNMVGSTLMQGNLKPGNNTLPLDALQPGIYMLALIDEEGVKTVHKVVKE